MFNPFYMNKILITSTLFLTLQFGFLIEAKSQNIDFRINVLAQNANNVKRNSNHLTGNPFRMFSKNDSITVQLELSAIKLTSIKEIQVIIYDKNGIVLLKRDFMKNHIKIMTRGSRSTILLMIPDLIFQNKYSISVNAIAGGKKNYQLSKTVSL